MLPHIRANHAAHLSEISFSCAVYGYLKNVVASPIATDFGSGTARAVRFFERLKNRMARAVPLGSRPSKIVCLFG